MKVKKYIIFILFLIIYSNFAVAQEDCSNLIDLAWVRTAGGNIDDKAMDVAVDTAGNIFVTGFFQGQLHFLGNQVPSNGEKDLFIVKLDPNGNLLWLRTGGGKQDVSGTGIDVDTEGNVYVTGTFEGDVEFQGNQASSIGGSDIFLLKYDSDGNYIWGNFFGGFLNNISGGVAIDHNENPVIIGSYRGSISIDENVISSNGNNDYFIAKFSPNGNLQWVTTHGGTHNVFGRRITCNGSNIYATGEFGGNLNIDVDNVNASGDTDVFLVKYLTDGTPVWVKSVGSVGDADEAGSVATDIFGNVYVCLYASQHTDFQSGKVQKFSKDGNILLDFNFGNMSTYPRSIIADNSQDIFITGKFAGVVDFGDGAVSAVGTTDFFFTQFTNGDQLAYKYVAGSSNEDGGYSITSDNENNIIIAGFCSNLINFGGTPYISRGLKDILIVKFDKYFSFEDIFIYSIDCAPDNMCVEVEATGGEPDYTYSWSGGQNDSIICGISVGDYSVTIYDSDNCYIEAEVNVEAPETPVVYLPPSIEKCPHDIYILDAGSEFLYYYWSTLEQNQTIGVYSAGTYSVTVVDHNECTGSASTNVTLIPSPNVLDDETYICPGEEITLSLSGFEEYLWSDSSTNSNFTTFEEGTYWVRFYDGECYFYDTITIILYPEPSVDLGGNVQICYGDSVVFDAGPGFESYLWNDNSDDQTLTVYESGNISVTVTDINSCEATDRVNVNVVIPPQVNLMPRDTICTDDPVTLYPGDTEEGNTYLWSDGSTADTLLVDTVGQYWVHVTDTAGCVTADTVYLAIFSNIYIDIGYNIEFCEGDSAVITVQGDFVEYIWSNGDTGPSTTVYHTDTISVFVIAENSCTATDTVFVYENLIPDPYLGSDTVLCEGHQFLLSPEHSYAEYIWQDGSRTDTYLVTQFGLYSLTVTDDVGCTKSAEIYIGYAEGPIVQSVITGIGTVELIVGGGEPPYLYTHNNMSQWQSSNYFENLYAESYVFTIIDENLCYTEIEIEVESIIDIPSFFTPNGDGHNDFWEIEGIALFFPDAEIIIYDRFGKKITEFTGSNLRWDGTYGTISVPSDTYWYVIKLEQGTEPITGPVTIKR